MAREVDGGERADSVPMSMYSQLLIASSVHGSPQRAIEDDVAYLRGCRRRLGVRSPEATDHEPAGALADNVTYDLALLNACQAREITCDARLFDQPLLERRRLEEELAKLGVDVAGPAPP